MKNKITLLASLIPLIFINNAFSQNEEAKDNLGRPLLYCKDYMIKATHDNGNVQVLYNDSEKAYYLFKNSNSQIKKKSKNKFRIIPKDGNMKECTLPVKVKDSFAIEVVGMKDNDKYLSFQTAVDIFSQSYYYVGSNISNFYLQEPLNKEKNGYNLVNVIDDSILFCFHGSCTSVGDLNAQYTSFEFIAIKKEDDCEQNTGFRRVIQKADKELVNFDKTVIQPSIAKADKELVNFDKTVIQPSIAKADKELVNFDKTVIQPSIAKADKELVNFDKTVIQPSIAKADKELVSLDKTATQPFVKEVDQALVKFDEEVTQPVVKEVKKFFKKAFNW
ncbi:hypothetical protein [Fluviispira sanaruensis]|uniref:Uncharacterized protein n=1 Tax=Fluviispira sanaruensis TaxID=2493639 RepID=A0A4P2VVH8_FLUSA|nr:hypothetical protein [Fluviispira sanaruensis]BBH53545.1 hypothetical protein JCM31447_19890 [Fluviispira sanaruensis]